MTTHPTPTPRTDALSKDIADSVPGAKTPLQTGILAVIGYDKAIHLCAQLERDLTAAQATIAELREALTNVISTLSKDGIAYEPCDAPMLEQCAAALRHSAPVTNNCTNMQLGPDAQAFTAEDMFFIYGLIEGMREAERDAMHGRCGPAQQWFHFWEKHAVTQKAANTYHALAHKKITQAAPAAKEDEK